MSRRGACWSGPGSSGRGSSAAAYLGRTAAARMSSPSRCCPVTSGILIDAQYAVVVGAAPVDDARPAGFLVVEQVEVVAEQLHVEQRVLDGHRVALVFLLPHDAPWLVVVGVPRFELGLGLGRGLP